MALYVYGGSFNPPHLAHVLALCTVRAQASDFEGAIVVPTYQHAFAKRLAPFEDRLAMLAEAVGWIPGVTLSRIEAELGGESRTLRTLEALQTRHPGASLRLLIGADILLETDKWHAFEAIERLAPPYVLGRVGVAHPRAPLAHLPAISSSEIRDAIARRDWEAAAARLPAAVLRYVQTHQLYTSQ